MMPIDRCSKEQAGQTRHFCYFFIKLLNFIETMRTDERPDNGKNIGFWIKLLIAVLTGIASALGVSAAMHATGAEGFLHAML